MLNISSNVTLNNPAFIHDTAFLYGKISMGEGTSVWPYVVMRAEMHEILIGERTNIQDHVMIHVGYETPTVVGEDCSITHMNHYVILYICTLTD